MSTYKLEARGLRKVYPGTVALDDFTAGFTGGKVHSVIGKNGSGKSTLMKLFAGAIAPTAGEVWVDGIPVELNSPGDAFAKGIAMVYQELSLIPDLTVAENIFLNRYPIGDSGKTGIKGIISWKRLYREAEKLLSSIGIEVDVKAKVGKLSVGQQQTVEIAKAMSFNPSVLILDEPTSALAKHETGCLFDLIRRLKAKGVAVLYISHRLQELSEIADTVTVLRDGHLIGIEEMKNLTAAKIVEMMFGEVEQRSRPADLVVSSDPALEVKNLSRKPLFLDITFTLYKGEVLGIAGMLGSGRTELLRAIFGADSYSGGEIFFEGKPIIPGDPGKMRDRGLAMTPENRKSEGLIQGLSIRQNICMASMDRIGHRGFITRRMESACTEPKVRELDIKIGDAEHLISSLSGGNQQKVVIGNWLNTAPKVVLFDEPSRGIDVHAKQQIFQIMWDLSRRGLSSIFVSTELEELVEVCHRILIMKGGRIVDQVYPEQISVKELYAQCMEE
jgi:ribose transport system ATP-binding protein